MSYSRAGRTTIGPRCLSAVFGMGTGVSTRARSPAVSLPPQSGCSVSTDRLIQRIDVSSVVRVASLPRGPRKAASDLHRDSGGGRGGAAKRSAVSTGPLSASPHLHVRPIDPVISREPSLFAGDLILGEVSRLYAFSAYPFRTWLPGDAASATTGTPEVRPSQSSRTREKAPRVSCARSR